MGVGTLAACYALSGALTFTAGFFPLAGLIVLVCLRETKGAELR